MKDVMKEKANIFCIYPCQNLGIIMINSLPNLL